MLLSPSHNPSVMVHQFSQVPQADIPRSSFDRSHGYKTALDAGYLVPFFIDEALPGDTFNLSTNAIARLATPIFPIMDNMFMDTHFFSVPIRLIWDNWQRFNGEQRNPSDSTDFAIPHLHAPAGGFEVNSLEDYFGIPTGVAGLEVSALWHRAYNLIWSEWFRDQNLQSSAVLNTDDGPDDPAEYVLRRRGKRHDYFTSSLPWPQKGPGVSIPIGGTAPVHGNGKALGFSDGTNNYGLAPASNGSNALGFFVGDYGKALGGVTDFSGANAANKVLGITPSTSGNSGLVADLSAATAITINSLRQSFQIQKIFERDARGGTRYTELIKSHFGVTSPDARLQRPEFLGGGSTPVIISPVPQTAATSGTSPQGNLAAVGTAHIRGHGFTSSFTEHCIIIGLVSVRADLTYQQGLNRMFNRRTRFDFYWPALSNIGEQAVLSKEIYCDGTAGDETVFGYQERYAEYRYKPSMVTGILRSSAPAPLDSWHLSQDFATRPVLDQAFIYENPPLDRCIAVPTEPHFILDCYHRLHCARPMPVYGVPGLMDHF